MDTSRKWIPQRNQLSQVFVVKSQQQRHGTYKADSAQVDRWQGTKEATSDKGLDLLQPVRSFCSCCSICDNFAFALQAARKSAPTTGGVKKVLVVGKHLFFVSLCRVRFPRLCRMYGGLVKSRTADLLTCVLCSLTDTGPEQSLYVRSGSIKSPQSCLSGSFHSRGL